MALLKIICFPHLWTSKFKRKEHRAFLSERRKDSLENKRRKKQNESVEFWKKEAPLKTIYIPSIEIGQKAQEIESTQEDLYPRKA